MDNSENNPTRAPDEGRQGASSPESNPLTAGQSDVDDLSGQLQATTGARPSRPGPGTERDEERHRYSSMDSSQDERELAPRPAPPPSFSDAMDSDSEAEEAGVSRCRCSSRSSPSPPPMPSHRRYDGRSPTDLSTEEFYGEQESTDSCRLSADRSRVFPSTSQQTEKLLGAQEGCNNTDTGRSSCSLEEQMEEMVSKLKMRGSLGRKRSRSRSRRSRARQSCKSGIVMTNMRVVQAFPLRETDSDDSNTESRTSFSGFPPPFFSVARRNTSSISNNQSNSSFHSATESDRCLTPQTSSANNKGGEEEEEDMGGQREGGGPAEETGEESGATDSRSRTDHSISLQIQELSSYGPEEFVLDLLLAMCRGSWSDIL